MLEIAGGIVIAVIILWVLPLILVSGVAMILLALAIGILAVLIADFRDVAIGLLLFLAVLFLAGSPFLIWEKARQKYPKFDAVLKGDPPYDKWKRQTLIGTTSVTLLALAIFAPGLLLVIVTAYVCIGLPIHAIEIARSRFPRFDTILKSDGKVRDVSLTVTKLSTKAAIGISWIVVSGTTIYLMSIMLQRMQ
jgi:hypothetical protein